MDKRGATTNEIAAFLFPDNGHPDKALRRVLREETELTASQISALASYFDIPINDLFEIDQWDCVNDNDTITLKKGDYTAQLNTVNMSTKIWHDKSLFHDRIIPQKSISLRDYIEELNNLTS